MHGGWVSVVATPFRHETHKVASAHQMVIFSSHVLRRFSPFPKRYLVPFSRMPSYFLWGFYDFFFVFPTLQAPYDWLRVQTIHRSTSRDPLQSFHRFPSKQPSSMREEVYFGENGFTIAHRASLLPQIPLIARVTLLHLLRLSPQAHYLDLRSVLVISVLRALCLPSRPKNISTVQRLTLHDPGVKGRIWISKYTAPASPG